MGTQLQFRFVEVVLAVVEQLLVVLGRPTLGAAAEVVVVVGIALEQVHIVVVLEHLGFGLVCHGYQSCVKVRR